MKRRIKYFFIPVLIFAVGVLTYFLMIFAYRYSFRKDYMTLPETYLKEGDREEREYDGQKYLFHVYDMGNWGPWYGELEMIQRVEGTLNGKQEVRCYAYFAPFGNRKISISIPFQNENGETEVGVVRFDENWEIQEDEMLPAGWYVYENYYEDIKYYFGLVHTQWPEFDISGLQ